MVDAKIVGGADRKTALNRTNKLGASISGFMYNGHPRWLNTWWTLILSRAQGHWTRVWVCSIDCSLQESLCLPIFLSAMVFKLCWDRTIDGDHFAFWLYIKRLINTSEWVHILIWFVCNHIVCEDISWYGQKGMKCNTFVGQYIRLCLYGESKMWSSLADLD